MKKLNKIEVFLPSFFKPKFTANLVRLGRNNDGGYLIDELSIDKSKKLISFGINDDFSFEMNFNTQNRASVFAFDNSIDMFFFLKKFVNSIFTPNHPKRLLVRFLNLYNYIKFFRKENKHIKKNITLKNTTTEITFSKLYNDYIKSEKEKIFLKIDIEGSEYLILDEIIKIQKNLTGVIIEFHDVNKNLIKIKKFINSLTLSICHVHCNNTGGLSKNKLPNVIEITFSNNLTKNRKIPFLPNIYDMPNSKKLPEYKINFN